MFQWLADSITYAANNGADVINNSWGCGGACGSVTVNNAIDAAFALGVVVVFSAGNDTLDISTFDPQNKIEVLAVETGNNTGIFFADLQFSTKTTKNQLKSVL